MTLPKPQAPKRTKQEGHADTEELETHPAYGQVGISRVSGQAKLYGSALDHHQSFIRLEIRHSERRHSLHRDWHFGKDVIVEVNLSHAQFAEMITTPNVGTGVPCTLSFHSSKPGPGMVPPIAESMQTEAEKVVEGFREGQVEVVEKLRGRVDEAQAVLDKKSINKGDRELLRGVLDFVMREVESNRPFAVSQFQEAAEKVVTQGKAEIEAFTTMAVQNLGLSKLSELAELASGEQTPRLIEASSEDD
jgi:hypothetical protein